MRKKDIISSKSSRWGRRAIPFILTLLTWVGAVLAWCIIIALVVDMPSEYKLRHSVDKMRAEYELLTEHYDSLNLVLDNVVDRDENVFRKLFESNPYDLSADYKNRRYELHSSLVTMDNDQLQAVLGSRLQKADNVVAKLNRSVDDLSYAVSTNVLSIDCVPSIQPVNNKQLTLLAAGKKPLINPFHRAMREHHGVDYLVPEGTAVFATADGVVKTLSEKNSTHGKAVVIDHGNGYETSYSHLLDIRVRKGDRVRRGDIIALSGNTGLSFAPHLHYEVIYNDMRVDPVHYFFMELTCEEYQRIIRIALSSMQSFD